ncbi:hypothetical protein SETIT_8G052600v2 [Setaria italica]|uniref:DUF1618 domain-containing protein n=1 Tax=Setaria italica TaxID=4555 RepID=A0A368S4M0_SETIT|nr:hypothetical protein SETIT_8G052600v2 [Setaria italica]
MMTAAAALLDADGKRVGCRCKRDEGDSTVSFYRGREERSCAGIRILPRSAWTPKLEFWVGQPRNVPTKHEEGTAGRDPYCRPLAHLDSGVLRRGDDELLVAQLEVMPSFSERRGMADLCVLRHGRGQWELKRSLPIVHDHGDKVDQELDCWQGSNTTAASSSATWRRRRAPCSGIYLCLLSPIYDPRYYTDDLEPLSNSSSMGAAGPAAVRFLAVEPRCCCGGFGRSSCERSRNAFTVTTWTMNLSMDKPMTWVKDGALDCEELWALPGYEGIPRVHPQHPVVSLDNPDVVCFKVVGDGDRKARMIQVDMKRKVLLSAVKCTTVPLKTYYYLPAKLQ